MELFAVLQYFDFILFTKIRNYWEKDYGRIINLRHTLNACIFSQANLANIAILYDKCNSPRAIFSKARLIQGRHCLMGVVLPIELCKCGKFIKVIYSTESILLIVYDTLTSQYCK